MHTKLKNIVMNRLRIRTLSPSKIAPSSLSQGIIAKLLGSRLNFGKLIFASTLSVGKISTVPRMAAGTLLTKGSVILMRFGAGGTIRRLMSTIRSKRLDGSRLSTGYHGMLVCGCVLNLEGHRPRLQIDKVDCHVGARRTRILTTGLHHSTIAMLGGCFSILPLTPIRNSVTILDVKRGRTSTPFIRTVGGGTNVDRFRLP